MRTESRQSIYHERVPNVREACPSNIASRCIVVLFYGTCVQAPKPGLVHTIDSTSSFLSRIQNKKHTSL